MKTITNNITSLKDNHGTAAITLRNVRGYRIPAAYDVLMHLDPNNAGNALSELIKRIEQEESPLRQAGVFLELVEKART